MGKIKKAAGPKHEATLSPAIAEFVSTARQLPLSKLPSYLAQFPRHWPFPRGDLYNWIPLLNHFDTILERFIAEYGLQGGPQTKSFDRTLLRKGISIDDDSTATFKEGDETLDTLGYAKDGDQQLILAILEFTRLLLEHCGNRSLYSSSDRLGEILNTTSLSLLSSTLRLAVRLAQRYHASRQKGPNANQQLHNALLASHYNIDLEKVQQMANPFPRTSSKLSQDLSSTSSKGKAKSPSADEIFVDMLAVATEEESSGKKSAKYQGKGKRSSCSIPWEEWGAVHLRYYKRSAHDDLTKDVADSSPVHKDQPNTPTPSRRPSGLSKQMQISDVEAVPATSSSSGALTKSETTVGGMQSIDLPVSTVSARSTEEILQSYIPTVPKEASYELLTKVRVASAMTSSPSTRQQLLGIRLLAITNLAYIYPEQIFQQKIIQPDSEEPRRFQLIYQIADLVHAPGNGRAGASRWLQTLGLETLQALSKLKTKGPDVCAALNVNVNHGVLLYLLRSGVASIANQEDDDDEGGQEEWREALFSLLEALPPAAPRTGESLVSAGMLEPLVELLDLRTPKAERVHATILGFLNTIIYQVRDSIQAVAAAKGFDAIAALVGFEVDESLRLVNEGKGMSQAYKTQTIDYGIPYYHQQTLRWLFKFINHMMSHGNGGFDRILRNLIDSPQLLGGIREVIKQPKRFGSTIWSNAVSIVSSFIHNEPTSYAIIAEAGLTRSILECVTSEEISDRPFKLTNPEAPLTKFIDGHHSYIANDLSVALQQLEAYVRAKIPTSESKPPRKSLAIGIIPSTETIMAIPQAFGAICLNNAGMEVFLHSSALERFFECFESPEHVNAMNVETDLPRMLGTAFDELVRHHPRLKNVVLGSVFVLLRRITILCEHGTFKEDGGSQLWYDTGDPPEASAYALHRSASAIDADRSPTEAISSGETRSDIVMGEDNVPNFPSDSGPKVREPPKDTDLASYLNTTLKFLAGLFENHGLCAAFADLGGFGVVLKLACCGRLQYDFNNQSASQELAHVIRVLGEQKPYVVMPALMKEALQTINDLTPFLQRSEGDAFFMQYVDSGSQLREDNVKEGSHLVKMLIRLHTLCSILFETYSLVPYQSRSSPAIFSSVNLWDLYPKLLEGLLKVHGACVWEEILLSKNIPETWKNATKIKGYGMGSLEADTIFGFTDDQSLSANLFHNSADRSALQDNSMPSTGINASSEANSRRISLDQSTESPQFRNAKILRYLLSQVPSSIIPLVQNIGKSFTSSRRRLDSYSRQRAIASAEAWASAALSELSLNARTKSADEGNRYAYWVVMLTSISQLMVEGSFDHSPGTQCVTLLLQAFKNAGGFDTLVSIFDELFEHVRAPLHSAERKASASAHGAMRIILGFFAQIAASKTIVDSKQTQDLLATDRERGQPAQFNDAQLVVELRLAVIHAVRRVWESEYLEESTTATARCVIDILKSILLAADEHGALQSGQQPPHPRSKSMKLFNMDPSKVTALVSKGFTADVAREALYRCAGSQAAAEDYCRLYNTLKLDRNPIPSHELEWSQRLPANEVQTQSPMQGTTSGTEPGQPTEAPSSQPNESSAANGSEAIAHDSLPSLEELDLPNPPTQNLPDLTETEAAEAQNGISPAIENFLSMSIDQLDSTDIERLRETPNNPGDSNQSTSPSRRVENVDSSGQQIKHLTVDDLNEERSILRRTIIDRALDVLNVHEELTFDLSDLISAATQKAADASTLRREIGETIVQSLVSLQTDEDLEPSEGKKIAAYASLLALVIQDNAFYEATLEQIIVNYDTLLSFLKTSSSQSSQKESPWVAQILLVLEKAFAQDFQPMQVHWRAPSGKELKIEEPMVVDEPAIISHDGRCKMFDLLMEALPHVGKDETLALSIVRVLVMLSRLRTFAVKLREKMNIQRLFVMIKQLAGITNNKLQGSFMMLLRNVVEDNQIVKDKIKNGILDFFDERSNRPVDTSNYVKSLSGFILRSPTFFVEVTNELVEIKQFDSNSHAQILTLKSQGSGSGQPPNSTATGEQPASNGGSANLEQATKDNTHDRIDASPKKQKGSDLKVPVVENPSGVIHHLLCELLSYKDVDDKEPSPAVKPLSLEAKDSTTSGSSIGNATAEDPMDPASTEQSYLHKSEKPEFKADQHPIHVYRCFLLQCLTELLMSYNKTKVEFINFSRSTDAKATTPSKPRPGVLPYLLKDLIPLGTLNPEETVDYRKRSSIGHWAVVTIVALCQNTLEPGPLKKIRSLIDEEADTDLTYIRKFVLEICLKAYRDANSSSEELDCKYSRLLHLAELFSCILSGKLSGTRFTIATESVNDTQHSIAKIMFEKNYISALTASIADMDLNFPGSKRAVKYVLRPLKQLAQTALALSENDSLSTAPLQTEDDELSIASSVSGAEAEREETPDLFRNSALGMFEPRREDESTSESSQGDEEMYDDEYDEGMEYEEEMEPDNDEVVSDEEDEIEGAGPVEGLPGDSAMDVEVVIDEEEESSSEDDHNDEDSEDMDLDDHDVEVIDEITGDNENASLAEGEDDGWQDEDEDVEDDENIDEDDSEIDNQYTGNGVDDIDASFQGPASAIQELMAGFEEHDPGIGDDEEPDGDPDIENMEDMAGDDEEMDDDEDEGADDEDGDAVETDVVFGDPEYENETSETPWLWGTDDDSMPIPRAQHHHHSRRFHNPWSPITVAPPLYRSGRLQGSGPSADDGVNPLLRRFDQRSTGSRSEGDIMSRIAVRPSADWRITADEDISAVSREIHNNLDGHVSLFENILATIGQSGPGIAPLSGMQGALSYYISGNHSRGSLRSLQALLGSRPQRPDVTRENTNSGNNQHATFVPASTTLRWQEQSRLLFANDYLNKANRIVNALLRDLVPPAVEKEKIRRANEERRLKEAKELEEKQEQERIAKEKAEQDANEAKEKAQREAAAEAEAEAARTRQQEGANSSAEVEPERTQEADEMQGVEQTEQAQPSASTDTAEADHSTAEPNESGPSELTERVRATIRGRELDITGMGVDLEYLNALPEDLREEVLMGQLADQRSQAAAAGEEPSTISREFLDALPPEIREELLQNEAQDRRRQEREEARRRAAANNPQSTTTAEEMDPASFLASLEPNLRQAVLAEQDDDVLNQLPDAIAAEARALGADRSMHRFGGIGGLRRRGEQESRERDTRRTKTQKPPRRQIVQMLDRAGVATLLRLMFIPQHGSSRQTLNDILHAVSQNRQNRAEIVGMLLSILQDGSMDVNAIERSFTQLSIRAKQPSVVSQKTSQPLQRSLTNQISPLNCSDMTPLMVIQQCLGALVSLTQYNLHIPSFFLTEHEGPYGLKQKFSKKGKSKETKASRYAINALLSLLDRKLIIESSNCTEQLSSLLQIVTHPLTLLHRVDRNAEEPKKDLPTTETTDSRDRPSRAQPETEVSAPVQETSNEPETNNESEVPSQEIGSTQTDSAEPSVTVGSTETSGDHTIEKKSAEEERLKKAKSLTPPEIPEENLRLVVNVLAARECSSKAFRDTLSTINNLSAIPKAKEIFGKGLVEQAEHLGKVIFDDLNDLLAEAQKNASTDADFQALALSKFSPASSDQAKLLRVLSALDYLFDPKRSSTSLAEQDGRGSTKVPEPSAASASELLKQDLVTALYEHPTFGSLWIKLSECLVAIREREGMIGVATILLPLIESLMVVCKNTTMKDATTKVVKEFQISSPAPESRMDSLFFRFTEEHRKVLNELVRNNPKLMSGTFSLLVKNPNVLEFDNKRNYFIRKLHARGAEARHSQPPLQLNIRRDQVFLDSFKALFFRTGDEIKYGKLNIRFHGEEGVDAGGVTREWFQVLSRQMFNPDYALFVPVASDRTTFHPNKNSYFNEEHLDFFKFIGRIIGKALYEGRPLDCHFSRAVYKRILGRTVSIKDMETLDLDYYKSLVWMLENDITEVITETFSIETEDFGAKQIVDLVENGRNIPVTEENKQEYAQLVVEHRLTGSVQIQLEHFLKGKVALQTLDLPSTLIHCRLPRCGLSRLDLHLQRARTRASHLRSPRNRSRRLEE